MDLIILRNKAQVEDLCSQLRNRRLPYKIMIQEIYPLRSIESNNYMWGIVYQAISEATGHTPEEIHDTYKKKFLFRGDLQFNPLTRQYDWVVGLGSTTKLDDKEIWDFIAQVCADAELSLNIIIPLPSEIFIPEISYEHDKIKTRRI